MSTYPLEKLLSLWKSKELSAEQAIGHIIQNLLLLQEQLASPPKRQTRSGSLPAEPEKK